MLPKANRLKHRQDFNAVYQRGKKHRAGRLLLRALPRQTVSASTPSALAQQKSGAENLQPTRIGISISQKVSKRSVVRNRMKRQIRAALRQLLPRILPGWDCILVVLPQPNPECNYGQFLQELEQLLAQGKVLDGHSRRNIL